MALTSRLPGCEKLQCSLHGETPVACPWKADHRSGRRGQRGRGTPVTMDGLKTIMKFIPIPRSRWLPLGSSSGLNQPSRRVRRNGVHSTHSSLGYQIPACYAGIIAATDSNAAQYESLAFPPVATNTPIGVFKTAGAVMAVG